MPGFRLCEEDKKSINTGYLCTYCGEALRYPVQTIACGHRYCRTCLDTITSDPQRSRCVEDGTQLKRNEFFSDKVAWGEMLDFVVYCVNFPDGCIWQGELRDLKVHEVTCEFVKIPCIHPEYGSLVTKAELANHVQKQCAFREHQCGYCSTPFLASYLQKHQKNNCPAYPMKCPHCGKEGIPRSEMPAHLSATTGGRTGVGCQESKAHCVLYSKARVD